MGAIPEWKLNHFEFEWWHIFDTSYASVQIALDTMYTTCLQAKLTNSYGER